MNWRQSRPLAPSLGGVLSRLPAYPGSWLFARMLNATLAPQLAADTRTGLEGRRLQLRVSDLGLAFDVCWRGSGFTPAARGVASELSIAASLHDLWLLAQREEDPDSLFFRRRLIIEGDTELGLLLKSDTMNERFLWAQQQGFIPAGRINSAVGMGMKATLMNCFVQPVGDSVTGWHDGMPGIYTALAEAAETMRRGGGVGYDFSAIRPCGSKVKGTHARASGPVSYMEVFDASCKTVESAGARRGAQMGVLRIDHPDIERFVTAKHDGAFTNFNLSLAVTDGFMQALASEAPFELVHAAEPSDDQIAAGAFQRPDGMWVYRTVGAAMLWQAIMQSTYDHAEPGVLFIDRINGENNLYYAEQLCATNPCGEQPLPAYGCCDLGSINLTRFVDAPFTHEAALNFARLREVSAIGVRMLDLALDATKWPLPQQEEEGRTKRRVGLGFLGLGSALVMLGIPYDSEAGRTMAARIAEEMRDAAYAASIALAREKGPFPRFDAAAYLGGQFVARLPQALRTQIAEHGIRNSHLLSIAPTGSITLAFADNASNGIEPAFSWVYFRKKRMADGTTRSYEVADHAWRRRRTRHGRSRRGKDRQSGRTYSAALAGSFLQSVQRQSGRRAKAPSPARAPPRSRCARPSTLQGLSWPRRHRAAAAEVAAAADAASVPATSRVCRRPTAQAS